MVCRVSCGGVSNMLLVLSITFYFHYNRWVVCVQLAHLHIVIGDWKDLSIAHVIIIIKSEVSTFPIVFILFRGCVPEMFVTSYSVTYCIYITGKPGICFVFSSIVQFMMSANSRTRFGLQIVFVCLYITPSHCPACRTTLIATRFWVVMICPIIKCLTVLEFSFILFDLCLFITIFNFILNYVPIVTFWIFTYHKIWILLIIFCLIWSYWIIHF